MHSSCFNVLQEPEFTLLVICGLTGLPTLTSDFLGKGVKKEFLRSLILIRKTRYKEENSVVLLCLMLGKNNLWRMKGPLPYLRTPFPMNR